MGKNAMQCVMFCGESKIPNFSMETGEAEHSRVHCGIYGGGKREVLSLTRPQGFHMGVPPLEY